MLTGLEHILSILGIISAMDVNHAGIDMIAT